jgi:YbbR domain-containing protein
MAGPSLAGGVRWPALVASLLVAIGLFLTQQIIRISEQELTLSLELRHAEQTVVAGNPPEEVRIRIRGPEDTLALVDQLALRAEVDARTLPVGTEAELPVSLIIPDPSLADQISWEATPATISVLLDRYAEREVAVNVRFSGSPAPGYQMDRFFVVPQRVRLAGPASIVEGVGSLQTVPVDLNERDSDFAVRLDPLLPDPRLSLPVESFVEFRGFLREVPTPASYQTVPVRVEAPGLDVRMPQETVTLTVRGLPSVLEQTSAAELDVILRLDSSDIPQELPAELQLSPEVLLPDGLELILVEPEVLGVEIRAQGVDQ